MSTKESTETIIEGFEKLASHPDIQDTLEVLVKIASDLKLDITKEDITSSFMSELEKSASLWTKAVSPLGKESPKLVSHVSSELAAKGLTGFGLGAGILGAMTAFSGAKNMSKRKDFERALEQVLRNSPVIQEKDKQKATGFAETIFRFAPTVASDPNLLGSVLNSAIHYESLDLSTIKSLSEIEAKHSQYSQLRPRDMVVM